jgi:hypothetical protein
MFFALLNSAVELMVITFLLQTTRAFNHTAPILSIRGTPDSFVRESLTRKRLRSGNFSMKWLRLPGVFVMPSSVVTPLDLPSTPFVIQQ